MPSEQPLHAVLAELMNDPALQSDLHTDFPGSSLYMPSEQEVQDDCPELGWYFPV